MNAYVFDNLVDLAGTLGATHDTATLLGRNTPGDGGGSPFFWDDSSTATGDGVMVVQVPGVAQGRWVRITENNTLNLCWFGAKADRPESAGTSTSNVQDNLPAMQAALDFVANHSKYRTIYVPSAPVGLSYFFSDTIHVYVNVQIEGEGNLFYDYPTAFSFLGTAGIHFHTAPTPTSHGDFVAALRRIHFGNIASSPYQADGQKHGVTADCRMIIEDVSVYNFQGCGFRLTGNVPASNSSLWEVHRCVARFNAEHGIHVSGSDCNVGNINSFDATSNKYWGILDESIYSCVWTNCHTNNNSVYGDSALTGSTCRVHTGNFVQKVDQGIQYYFACAESNTNQAPVPLQDTTYWTYLGKFDPSATNHQFDLLESQWNTTFDVWNATAAYEKVLYYVARVDNTGQMPEAGFISGKWTGFSNATWTSIGEVTTFASNLYYRWNSTRTFRSGGAIATVPVANNSVFVGPYIEGNQGHVLLRGGSILFGGETATPVLEGTFLKGGGGLSVPNGQVASGFGFRSLEEGGYSMEFNNGNRDLVRTKHAVDFTIGSTFGVTYLSPTGVPDLPTFIHDPKPPTTDALGQPVPAGKTLFGTHYDRAGTRYQFYDGDVSVLAGNFYAEVGGQLRVITPFVPIAANGYGTHPSFTTAQDAIAWLLQNM
ncbi:hypothetical protein [Hymenobacter ruricola]|uniref:Right-handed parallel beta-helix repeat-containing protein n=1 Tax=Hymenobacter ruricola TaxID=2791023 RepID=A0ABS0IBA7_9BACT|nr:hypothetical protein [Hymenobacter ruricola]MBF9224268.1 hypothetical protein [Hymenobacter ruricola]